MSRLSAAALLASALVISIAPGAARAANGPPKPRKCSVSVGVGADQGGSALAGLVSLAIAAGAAARRRR